MSLALIDLTSKTELIGTGFAKANDAITVLNSTRTITLTGAINGTISTVLSNANTITIPTTFSANVWTSANDGAGSGLDADLIRGQSITYWTDWSRLGNKPISSVGYGLTDVVRTNANTTIIDPYSLSFGATTRQMINLWATTYGVGIQNSTLYLRTGGHLSIHQNGVHNNVACEPGTGGIELARFNSNGLYLDPRDTGSMWFRTFGETGWYNETYAGGWYMTDTRFLKSYNGKAVLIDRAWDNYGNVMLTGNAPSIVFYDSDNVRKWMWHCNADTMYCYRAITQSIDATDWMQRFAINATGGFTAYADSTINGALSISGAISSTDRGVFGTGTNATVSDGGGALEARSIQGGIPSIILHSPLRLATKISLSDVLSIGGWSWAADRMTLNGSGDAVFAGTVTASAFYTTGGIPVAGVKSVRHFIVAGSYYEASLNIGTFNINKTYISITSGISNAYIRLSTNGTSVSYVNQAGGTISFSVIEFY